MRNYQFDRQGVFLSTVNRPINEDKTFKLYKMLKIKVNHEESFNKSLYIVCFKKRINSPFDGNFKKPFLTAQLSQTRTKKAQARAAIVIIALPPQCYRTAAYR